MVGHLFTVCVSTDLDWLTVCSLAGTRTIVTGIFCTTVPHTSHTRSPLIPNHLNAHSLCARAISPRQRHSIFKVSPQSSVRESIQILHTASSTGIASSNSSLMDPLPVVYNTSIQSEYLQPTLELNVGADYEKLDYV